MTAERIQCFLPYIMATQYSNCNSSYTLVRIEAATRWWYIKPGWALHHHHWRHASDDEKRFGDGSQALSEEGAKIISAVSPILLQNTM